MVSIDDIIITWLFRISDYIYFWKSRSSTPIFLLISNKLPVENNSNKKNKNKTEYDCKENLEFLRILKLEGTEFWRFWKKKRFNFSFPTRILSTTDNFIENILKHTFDFDISVKTGIIKSDSSDYFPTISQNFFPLKSWSKIEKEYLMITIQARVMIETNIKIFSQS